MANVWVVDSNCFIHVGSMAPDGFLKDLKKILAADGSALYVTPGVHGEIKTFDFRDGEVNQICWMKLKI